MPNNKRIIIPDILFHKLWDIASKCDNLNEYYSYLLNPDSEGYISFKRQYRMDINKTHDLLKIIYENNHISFSDLLKKTDLKPSEVSHIYCIPIKTIEKWVNGTNRCPGYFKLILLRQTGNFKLPYGVYIKSQAPSFSKDDKVKEKKRIEKKNTVPKEDLKEILQKYENRRDNIIARTNYLDNLINSQTLKKDSGSCFS